MTLRDVLAPAAAVAGAAAGAAGFLAGRATENAADVGNQISSGQNTSHGERYRSPDEAKKQQIVKDMIAERTRNNSAN
ncbi:hypothetical protein PCI56_03645 [Plesiomonas shigelloides subsp. oncorhynchi]|nr:hypothetical protein [Plesiomonas shigelloides]